MKTIENIKEEMASIIIAAHLITLEKAIDRILSIIVAEVEEKDNGIAHGSNIFKHPVTIRDIIEDKLKDGV